MVERGSSCNKSFTLLGQLGGKKTSGLDRQQLLHRKPCQALSVGALHSETYDTLQRLFDYPHSADKKNEAIGNQFSPSHTTLGGSAGLKALLADFTMDPLPALYA